MIVVGAEWTHSRWSLKSVWYTLKVSRSEVFDAGFAVATAHPSVVDLSCMNAVRTAQSSWRNTSLLYPGSG